MLLGFLEDGVIVDSHGDSLDFRDSIIIFTSNVGVHDNVGKKLVGFQEDGKVTSYEDVKGSIEDAFKREFSPEFINRLDGVVHFNSLTKEDAIKVAKLSLAHLPIKATKKLLTYIVDNSFSVEYGARNIKRFIKNQVTLKLADKILSGETNKTYAPNFEGGELTDLEVKG